MLFLLLVRLVRAVKSMSDGISLNVDKTSVLVLANVYNDLLDRSERTCRISADCELHGFERALKIVGIDPNMLKGVDTSF